MSKKSVILTLIATLILTACDSNVERSISGTYGQQQEVTSQNETTQENSDGELSVTVEPKKEEIKFENIEKIGTVIYNADVLSEEQEVIDMFLAKWELAEFYKTEEKIIEEQYHRAYTIKPYISDGTVHEIVFHYASEMVKIDNQYYKANHLDCTDVFYAVCDTISLKKIFSEMKIEKIARYINNKKYISTDETYINSVKEFMEGFGNLSPYILDWEKEVWAGGPYFLLEGADGEELSINIGNSKMINMNGQFFKVEHEISVEKATELLRQLSVQGKIEE